MVISNFKPYKHKFTTSLIHRNTLIIGWEINIHKDVEKDEIDMLNDYYVATAITTTGIRFDFRYKLGMYVDYIKEHLNHYIINIYNIETKLHNIIYY